MIEIFKTNVHSDHHAANILVQIRQQFPHYHANFDLDDCDRILRILCLNSHVEHNEIVILMQHMGYVAEILPDEIPADTGNLFNFAAPGL